MSFLTKHTHVLIIVLLTLSVLIQYWSNFVIQINVDDYGAAYSQSQYVLGEKSNAKIDDATLYTYASHAYWQGQDPTTINFEHPPLAKYYYGIFLLLLGNPHWGSLLLFLGVLVLIDKLAVELKMSSQGRILLLFLVGIQSLFRVHTRYTLLDLPQLFGTLLVFWSAIKLETESKLRHSLLLGTGIGIVAGAKYWFPWLLIVLGFVLWEAVRNKKLKQYLYAVLIGIGWYLASYSMYFWHGHTFFDFVAFEWFRFKWFSGKTDVPKFLVLQTLFTGQFQAWWAENTYEKTQHWNLLWPVSFVTAFWIGFQAFLKKNYWMIIIIGYSLLLLTIFGIGAAASDRFFIQLLPFWMLALSYLVDTLLLQKNANKKNK